MLPTRDQVRDTAFGAWHQGTGHRHVVGPMCCGEVASTPWREGSQADPCLELRSLSTLPGPQGPMDPLSLLESLLGAVADALLRLSSCSLRGAAVPAASELKVAWVRAAFHGLLSCVFANPISISVCCTPQPCAHQRPSVTSRRTLRKCRAMATTEPQWLLLTAPAMGHFEATRPALLRRKRPKLGGEGP